MYAWMLRFCSKLKLLSKLRKAVNINEKAEIQQKLKELSGELYSTEVILAETELWKLVQRECLNEKVMQDFNGLQLFKDDKGMMRLRSRLTLDTEEGSFQNPIILVDHELVRRMIEEEHIRLGHAGVLITLMSVREKFFVIRGRRLVRRIVKACVICRKFQGKPCVVQEGPLPAERTAKVAAFQTTGVDLGGPLILRKKKKVWFAIFTCAVYRAVHLELVENISTEAFMMALRRFLARRGRVQTIYSDNGTNFVGTNNILKRLDWDKLQKESALRRICWKFNPPSAPWWGGWWERLVGVVKMSLRKTIGHAYLSYVELETIMCDIEATINTRPLTYLSDEPDDLVPITPAHFILDITGNDFRDLDQVDKKFLSERMKYVHAVRTHLRKRFQKEYFANLSNRRNKKNRETPEIKVEEVVLIENHQQKRINWPLGRVVKLFPGRDGKKRVAVLKVESGQLVRPVQRLYPLEIEGESDKCVAEEFKKTRSGRTVKPVCRLNL